MARLLFALSLGCVLGWAVGDQVADKGHREAYFGGSAHVQVLLERPLTLRGSHIGLSFKTCKTGPLLRQEPRPGVPGLSLELRHDGLLLSQFSASGPIVDTLLPSSRLLDNRWHTVEIADRLGNITLSSPGIGEVSVPGDPELAGSEATTVSVGGDGYEGCILEGPGLQLAGRSRSFGAVWGPCQTQCDRCGGCGAQGLCGPNAVCQCPPRFAGAHCEIDLGSPCFAKGGHPCGEGAACQDLPDGSIQCLCPEGRLGQLCELVACDGQCQNGGSCGADSSGAAKCVCPEGFDGAECELRLSPCPPDACLNGGTCEEHPTSGFRCRCEHTGYEGERCERNVDECEHIKPCLNGGTCFDTYGGYVCHCRPGFGGQNCEQNVDECSSNPCGEGATCIDKLGGFECVCAPGVAGCAPPCASSPCRNGATCRESGDSYKCACAAGFLGESCQIAECEINRVCLHGGNCTSQGCQCPQRATGTFCEISRDCTSEPCHNGAVCRDTVDGFECSCAAGFSGPFCDNAEDACLSKPCLNDGICNSNSASLYLCHCLAGFTGAQCESRIESCSCQNGGSCLTDGSCACSDGWNGDRCERALTLDPECTCQNGGSCKDKDSGGFYCECPAGFEGLQCESNVDDCQGRQCEEGKVCVDLVNGHECRCPEGFRGANCTEDMDHCVDHRCANGATCRDGVTNYTCICTDGWTGPLCMDNVDECNRTANLCNNGICVDRAGGYDCYCRPGFSGTHCDLDFDECLSHPCKNGAFCTNMVNGYNCTCPLGYTGKDCETNIDDCISGPCQNGGTCIDGVASVTCICPKGIEGEFCDINIDDCKSAPCINGGRCIDGIDSFECDCSDTGFEGLTCESNIDDCLPGTCHNGATCEDLVKGFMCRCHPGYTGTSCEIDIRECEPMPCQYNGTCLELSDQSLYSADNPLAELLPPQFSYENAAGFVCACPAGTSGDTCQMNIDECASSPCQHGVCQDLLNAYECKCDKGFSGLHCETDVNECEPEPCVHGTCRDLQADYLCECDENYGGRNCSVFLTGCVGEEGSEQCKNNGTCLAWLLGETDHRFNCTCPKGFHGRTCSRATTLSFVSNSSKVTVPTSRDEGYDISFSFRTTLSNGKLVTGDGFRNLFFLELVSGRLKLDTNLLNRIDGVFIGSTLNDGEWKHVFLSINSSHVVLSARDEQSIYPIQLGENATTSNIFDTTSLGGGGSTFRKAGFVGCMEDVIVNGKWVLPPTVAGDAPAGEDLGDVARVIHTDVEAGCQRTEQCVPNPCQAGGTCTDLWRTFSCDCQRPRLGGTCQHEMIAATFGRENATEGFVTVEASEEAKRSLRQVVAISMFVRTRKPDGVLFHLGAVDSDTVIWAQLEKGELSVHVNLNNSESYHVGGTRLDDGHLHLIEVVRNLTLVTVRINGTEYLRKTYPFGANLNAPFLYLGGRPSPEAPSTEPVRTVRQAPAALIDASIGAAPLPFKGILQDVQLSNGTYTLAVEFYPLNVPQVPPPFGKVIFDQESVLEGVQSDDNCKDAPCANGGICQVTWNDFECECQVGYKGKTCLEMEFCRLNECPADTKCMDVDAGFECTAEATFDGQHPPLLFQPPQRPDPWWGQPKISIEFRSTFSGELLAVRGPDREDAEGDFLVFSVEDGSTFQLTANISNWHWSWNGDLFRVGNWTSLSIQTNAQDRMVATVEDSRNTSDTALPTEEFVKLLRGGRLEIARDFRGCLGAVKVSGVLVPFFTPDKVKETDKSRHWNLISSVAPQLSCALCYEEECENGATCRNPEDSYECACLDGFSGRTCNVNIDECAQNKCMNNATCVDGIASYTCHCLPGYEGLHCEIETNECDSSPCENNGTCHDELATFRCVCPDEFVGDRCESLRRVTCENSPCFNKANCVDVPNNFTCDCRDGFEGFHCKTSFCEKQPCANGGECDPLTPKCVCPPGFEGMFCESEIDECLSNPCLHGGRCQDTLAAYKCNCTGTGFEGLRCEIDIDECSEKTNRCGKGACINLEGFFECRCNNPQYCGPFCNISNPCKDPESNPCQNEGECKPNCVVYPDYTCECKEGFTGTNCELPVEGAPEGQGVDIALIVVPIVIVLLLVGLIALAVFVSLARKKRATRGTYSPSQQEYCNPRLELDHVLKPPPEERLI